MTTPPKRRASGSKKSITRPLYLTGIELLCAAAFSTAILLFLPSLLLLGWRDILPLESKLAALIRYPLAIWLALVGCSAMARTLCRLFPVSIDASANAVRYSRRDYQAFVSPYGALCIGLLGATLLICLAETPIPIQGFLFASILAALYRRRLTRRALEQGNFLLYLRRFGTFREQLVLGELCATAPQGAPIIVIVQTAFDILSWDPLAITWKGVTRRDRLQGGPFYVSTEASVWKSAVENMIVRARMVIMDVSEYTDPIDFELRTLIANRSPQDAVLVADITITDDRAQEVLLQEWKDQMNKREKEISGWYEEYMKHLRPDRTLILEALASKSAEILSPIWPECFRMYGRSLMFGIIRCGAMFAFWSTPTIMCSLSLAFWVAAENDLQAPPATWLALAVLMPVALQVIGKWHLLFKRSADLELRRVLRKAFQSSRPTIPPQTLRKSAPADPKIAAQLRNIFK